MWGVAVGLYVGVMVIAYPSLEGELDLGMYPEAFRNAFGIADMSTLGGFLGAQFFNYIGPLVLSFFPILVLSAVIAGAEERGTIDVLLGKPLPRWQLVAGSFVTVAISLLGILAILTLFTWLAATLADVDLSFGAVLEGALSLWPISLFFGSLALLCSAIFRQRILAIAVPAAVLFGMYLLDVIGGLAEDAEALQSLSAFYYYSSGITEGVDWASFSGLVVAALVLSVLAVLAFRRRDIYT
jgi:ABC-2 type transport system permease protein